MKENGMKRVSLKDVQKTIRDGDYRYDAGAPEGPRLDDDFWNNAKIVYPEPKAAISFRVDRDVLDWFKVAGPGYQTRMNAVLRSFMEAKGRKSG